MKRAGVTPGRESTSNVPAGKRSRPQRAASSIARSRKPLRSQSASKAELFAGILMKALSASSVSPRQAWRMYS